MRQLGLERLAFDVFGYVSLDVDVAFSKRHGDCEKFLL